MTKKSRWLSALLIPPPLVAPPVLVWLAGMSGRAIAFTAVAWVAALCAIALTFSWTE